MNNLGIFIFLPYKPYIKLEHVRKLTILAIFVMFRRSKKSHFPSKYGSLGYFFEKFICFCGFLLNLGFSNNSNHIFFCPWKTHCTAILTMSKIAQIICLNKMLLKKFYSNQSQTESHYSTYIWAHCDSIWGQLEQNCGCNIFFWQIPYF